MKAVVLAGGLGTRAKPFTEYSPKSMIPVFDRPLVDYVVSYLNKFKILDEIVIVTHLTGRGMQIKNYFEGKERRLKKPLTFVNDENEDTGRALLKAVSHLRGEDFLVWFSDNLCPLNVTNFFEFYRERGARGCIAVSSVKKVETGFVQLGPDGKILKFLEKPELTLPLPECLGIYLFSRGFLREVEAKHVGKKLNLSLHILQKISPHDSIYAYDIGRTPWIDVESPIKIERNSRLVRKIVEEMGAKPEEG